MSWRHQLPVWSPVSGPMVWAGIGRPDRGALERWRTILTQETGARGVVLTASGTASLVLALKATGRQRPRIALPAWGCPDLASAALGADASVSLYDLNPATLGPDLESVTRAIRDGIDAIVVAHFFGVPVDLSPLRPLAAAAGALLIDDAAQGMGGQWGGRPPGLGGDLGVLSFGRGKGRTGGGGGALLAATESAVTRLEQAAASLEASPRAWREMVALAGLWIVGRPSLFRIPASIPILRLGEAVFHPPIPPRAMHPGIAAALIAGRDLAEREAAIRRSSGAWWLARLRGHPRISVIEVADSAAPGWLRFPVLIATDQVDDFSTPTMRSLGVMPAYPIPLGRLPGFAPAVTSPDPAGWPAAKLLAARLFTLPTHSLVSEGDRARLARLLRVPA